MPYRFEYCVQEWREPTTGELAKAHESRERIARQRRAALR